MRGSPSKAESCDRRPLWRVLQILCPWQQPSQKFNHPKTKKTRKKMNPLLSDSAISAFMSEVSNLIKLVDSRDITELHLKQKDCELIIRKKEALQQLAPAAPVVMMQPPQGAFSTQSQVSHATPPSIAPPSAPVPALPPAKGTKSSLPQLKCPMAGTFYRSPGPGEPAFVKVGDKVKKGQVVCIIENYEINECDRG